MRNVLKIFSFLCCLSWSTQVAAQVTAVEYSMVYNEHTELYDCYLYVTKGSTKTIIDRLQFNAQFSIVIPTGTEVVLASYHMPLIDNQFYKSTSPQEWGVTSRVSSPESAPLHDFYGITPKLAPASFYNDLFEGDYVHLFSLQLTNKGTVVRDAVLFESKKHPSGNGEGMRGGDFSNGFTIGSLTQIYKGIKEVYDNEILESYSNNDK